MTASLLFELEGMPFEASIERAAEVNVEASMTEACREGVRRFLDKSKD